MAKNLSLAELTALYANKGKNPKALFEADVKSDLGTVLPGSTTADKLSKLFFTRQSGLLPLRPSTWKSDKEHNTIAICLVIVDNLYHEETWRHWIEQGERAESMYKAQLFIHAKHPERITSPWVQERLIDVTFRPDWNSVEVVQSLLSVLDAALQYSQNIDDTCSTNSNTASTHIGACGRFILATESCLPLYDLETTGEMLYKEDCSWLKAYHTPQGSWEAGTCFRSVDPDIVPPKAVWKSLPGWVMLNRLHAMEIVTLTKMLGGWGQPIAGSRSVEDVINVAEYSNLYDPLYKDSYKGTPGLRWKESIVGEKKVENESIQSEITESATVVASADADVASSGASSVSTIDPAAVSVPTISSSNITKTATQPSLLSAWGAGGTWHEHNGSVFAPEEVFFPTVLSLLGYLRDITSTDNDTSSTGVKIAAVTFAEWAKKGDANPIAYDYFDAQLVQRMRSTGAVFGRKFTQNSVAVSEWSRVVEDCGAKSYTQYGSYDRSRSPQDRYHNDYNNTRNHNTKHNNRRDGDRYSNYSKNDRDYHDNNRYRDSRNNDNRNYDQRNYDNRNYNHDRYDDSREGRDYSDNKRRKY